MKKGYTDITVVLDRSGSMGGIKDDTIGGYNTFIEKQREVPGTATVTLVQFDDKYEVNYTAMNIKEVPKLNKDSFVPRGMTALVDAMGKSIDATGRRIKEMNEADRPENVIFVVITDGEENHSRTYSHNKVMDSIKHQTDKYNWLFVYLGANQDAIKVGGTFGFSSANSMSWGANTLGVGATYVAVADNMTNYRMGKAVAMNFTAADRDAAMGTEDIKFTSKV